MKRWKCIFAMALCLIVGLGLCGCQEKVVTVADIQDEEGQVVEYIEMQKFELKEKVKENGREKIEHCAVLIPVGYYESEEIPGMYLHERAPMESSNIYYSVGEGDNGIVSEELTQQMYKETIEEAFAESGSEVTVEITSFEEMDMDGIPAYKIRSSYEMDGNTILQLTYMILAEDTHTVTYSQSKDDEMMVDFEISEGQIKLVRSKEVQVADSE